MIQNFGNTWKLLEIDDKNFEWEQNNKLYVIEGSVATNRLLYLKVNLKVMKIVGGFIKLVRISTSYECILVRKKIAMQEETNVFMRFLVAMVHYLQFLARLLLIIIKIQSNPIIIIIILNTGDSYRLTLQPVFVDLAHSFRCHLRRRMPQSLYQIWFYVSVPGQAKAAFETPRQHVDVRPDMTSSSGADLYKKTILYSFWFLLSSINFTNADQNLSIN